jgi:hypothetical protein
MAMIKIAAAIARPDQMCRRARNGRMRGELRPGRGASAAAISADPAGQVAPARMEENAWLTRGQSTLLVQTSPTPRALVHVRRTLGPALQNVLELPLGQMTHRSFLANPISFA